MPVRLTPKAGAIIFLFFRNLDRAYFANKIT